MPRVKTHPVDKEAVHPIVKELTEKRRSIKANVEDVAEKTGCTGNYIQKLECGMLSPSFPMINAWADSLGYEVFLRPKSK